jgi:hypothetical protein
MPLQDAVLVLQRRRLDVLHDGGIILGGFVFRALVHGGAEEGRSITEQRYTQRNPTSGAECRGARDGGCSGGGGGAGG